MRRFPAAAGLLVLLGALDSAEAQSPGASDGSPSVEAYLAAGEYRSAREAASTEGDMPPSPFGAAGGGAMADFGSLMELIQTTVAPDTWEELGGPSTMAPYPAGIWIDPQGLLQEVTPVSVGDPLHALRDGALLLPDPRLGQSDHPGAPQASWLQPSALRCVSLRRLTEAVADRVAAGLPPTTAMENLAGLSHVRYVWIVGEGDDVVLAAPVGGIQLGVAPWPVDQRSGQVTLGLGELVTALGAVAAGERFGCSIDPVPERLQQATEVAERFANRQIPLATAADALSDALGNQRISVFGTAADRPTAWLLVEADRHMKQLALGIEPMPEGIPNYVDLVRRSIDQGPPTGQLLRLWLAASPIAVRATADRRALELAGSPVRLLSERQMADARGERQPAGRDERAEQFARAFTENYSQIAAQYPVYGRLRGLFQWTAVAQLMRQTLEPSQWTDLLGLLADPDAMGTPAVAVPRQTASIAVRHAIRHGRQQHQLLIASGGVMIDPAVLTSQPPTDYAPLAGLHQQHSEAPRRDDRWWWDASR